MIGAIVGDVVGSRFEFNNTHEKDFEFLSDKCFFTDDTVMTVAVCDAFLKSYSTTYPGFKNIGEQAIKSMRQIGQHYPNCGYGGMFFRWMFTKNPVPYYSFGNGAAMRVSACGWVAQSIEQAKQLSKAVTAVTHNHPEGLKGAESVAVAIYMARHGFTKDKIKQYINDNYYRINFTIDEIRDTYIHNETCQDSVPQAFEAFFEGNDFEEVIRIAVSLGGDSDTIAAIAGSVAEAYYGVPEEIEQKTLEFLGPELERVVLAFKKMFG